jgi:aspartyl/glutamyl-tRNA(Asn/Gln) amidotransferase C subunit
MHIDTHHIAKLARISLTENEHVAFTQYIGNIVYFIDTIESVAVSQKKVTDLHPDNTVREDVAVIKNNNYASIEVLEQSPIHRDNYVQVKKILN